MADGGTLKECLESLEKQQFGNCVVITLPCNPGAGEKPETPDDSKPETPDNKPETPDDSTPDSKPETPDDSKPETPDNKPEMPDNSTTETPDNSAPENKPGQEEGAETEYHAYVLRVVELVNEERAKAGLNPVTLRKNISAAAQVRAQETEVSFSHTRPDGTKFTTALAQAGVTYRGAGENIAWGQRTPEQVMNGWMNSAGHRANILNEKFTSIGVGYYQNAAGTNYWTQLFTY
ncbi:MAG: transporter [Roseburia sp.]|nr:transporter [Roseburia sp.]